MKLDLKSPVGQLSPWQVVAWARWKSAKVRRKGAILIIPKEPNLMNIVCRFGKQEKQQLMSFSNRTMTMSSIDYILVVNPPKLTSEMQVAPQTATDCH